MPLAETAILTLVAAWCLLLAWAIDRGGAVELVAGYQKGQYSEAREAELARDARNLLLVVVAMLALFVVDAWTDAVPRVDVLFLVIIVTFVGWLIWKWNVAVDTTTGTD